MRIGFEDSKVIFNFFQKFDPTGPGSTRIILIPKGPNLYRIHSETPSNVNLLP